MCPLSNLLDPYVNNQCVYVLLYIEDVCDFLLIDYWLTDKKENDLVIIIGKVSMNLLLRLTLNVCVLCVCVGWTLRNFITVFNEIFKWKDGTIDKNMWKRVFI